MLMPRLEEYQRKRRFNRTTEPSSAEAVPQLEGTFVVQKHAARRLHYDFRLAIDGALKSWAVPKGPSLNPADKRMAVETEDHPMSYADFEGIIPPGNYGAGTVMVWDRGRFRVEGQRGAQEQLDRGEIKFRLSGEKLSGSFVLVRTKRGEKQPEWLMIKHQDDAVDSAWKIDAHDNSVLTGRTLDEIAAELPPKRKPTPIQPAELDGAREAPMPRVLSPMLATLIDRPFSDPGWLFEIKWDGARSLAWIEDGKVRLRSRAGNEVTHQYPELATLPRHIGVRRALLDGEIVVLDDKGRSDFELMQQRMNVQRPSPDLLSRYPVSYYLFDLLYGDGYDLREVPLLERKALLRRILDPSREFRFSDHQLERGKELFELARQQNLEGIVGKRIDSFYSSARSQNWVKLKATKTLDLVVGGWTAPRGSRTHFGSLLLGLYQGKALRFFGHAGTGMDEKMRELLISKLQNLGIDECPFDKIPETNEQACWAKPDLVAHVRFIGWTEEPRLRAPVFLALRNDVRPEECRWESEVAPHAAPHAGPEIVRSPEIVGTILAKKDEIEAQLFSGKQESVTLDFEGKRFRLTHLNKVFFPESGYTKRDLVAYYYRIADYLLPFLKDRPLVLRRYPDGIKGQAFFQKNMPEGVPKWIETLSVPSEGKREDIQYVIANDLASLLYLTGLGCIDHNPWSSRRDDQEHPDYFFFDLDPAEGTEFSRVLTIARALHERLTQVGLKVFMKTSGATGFHLYLPVERVYRFEQLRMFGEIFAQLVTAEHPDLVTHERIVAKRRPGRVLIDVTQNSLGRPLAAPYTVRAFPKGPVSAPVEMGELRPALKPERFNIKNLEGRLKQKGDLWAGFWKSRQRIEPALDQLGASALEAGERPKPR
jgi:bifunctional non-homologous end joining protein LigD